MRILFISFSMLIAILFANQVRAQDWVKQNIDDILSIQFPMMPSQEGPAWIYKANDSSIYTAYSVDLSPYGLDSATLASQAPSEMFFDQFKNSFAAQIPGFEITKSEITIWNNYPAYAIEGEIKDKSRIVFINCIFINTTCYTFVFGSDKSLPLTNKEAFFKSVEEIK